MMSLPWRVAARSLRFNKRRTSLVVALVGIPVAVAVWASSLATSSGVSNKVQASLTAGGSIGKLAPAATGEWRTQHQELVRLGFPADSVVYELQGRIPVSANGRALLADIFGSPHLTAQAFNGRFPLKSGTLPTATDELALSQTAADRLGVSLGEQLVVVDRGVRLVGILLDPRQTDRLWAAGSADLVQSAGTMLEQQWWVQPTAQTPVAPQEAFDQATMAGWTVSERVLTARPPDPVFQKMSLILFPILIVALSLVGILAANAFLMSADDLSRETALLGVVGMSSKNRGKTLVYQGLTVGLLAAAVGVPVGLALTWLSVSPISGWFSQIWKGVRVNALEVLLIAALGIATAGLACWAVTRRLREAEPIEVLRPAPRRRGAQKAHAFRWVLLAAAIFVIFAVGLALTRLPLLLFAAAAAALVAGAWMFRALIDTSPPSTSRSLSWRLALGSTQLFPGRVTALASSVGAIITVAGVLALIYGNLTDKMARENVPALPDGSIMVTVYREPASGLQNEIGANLGNRSPITLRYARLDGGFATIFITEGQCAGGGDCRSSKPLDINGSQPVGLISTADLTRLLGRSLTPEEAQTWQTGGILVTAGELITNGSATFTPVKAGPPVTVQATLLADQPKFSGSELPNAFANQDKAGTTFSPDPHQQLWYYPPTADRTPISTETQDTITDIIRTSSPDGGYAYVDRGPPAVLALKYIYLGLGIVLAVWAGGIAAIGGRITLRDSRIERETLHTLGTQRRTITRWAVTTTTTLAAIGALLGLLACLAVSPLASIATGNPWIASPLLVIAGASLAAVAGATFSGWRYVKSNRQQPTSRTQAP